MRRALAVLSALSTVAMLPVVSGSVAGVAQAAPASCPSLYVVAIPGTWETSTKADKRPSPGMLASATNGLPSSVRTDYVTYAATAFPWETNVYAKSKLEAVNNARGMIDAMAKQCGSTRFALIGYSQGADAAGDLAAEIGTGRGVVPADKVAGVGLLSDPSRSETDTLIGPRVVGNGSGGARIGGFGWLSDRTVTMCAVGDLYCSTAEDDFVTRFAGFLAQSSDATPALMGQYRLDAGVIWRDLLAAGGVPTLMGQLDDSSNDKRVDQLEQFYGSQVHQDYSQYAVDGSGTSATSWLRNWLRQKA